MRDDGGETVSLKLARTYEADADDVWDALTNPERLPRWFYPISGDLRIGGSFQFEGNAGGEIRQCDRPTRLQVTFGGPDSVVEVGLSESGAETTVELTHTVPLAMAGSGAGALFVGPGWDGALLGLGIHLRGEAVGDPLEAANSPEVVGFNRGSIDRWVEAIDSSGTATAEEIAGAREVAVARYTVVP
ncbi:SRPBCC family protein [Agromyces sp. Soil535]|uniref:SRPBCC family protein n=1 Tax=Agromyces sp. Soil535 TaxID=1736390 RepID=UPI001F46C506|nr:SRPBCC family protein [Agromyces sp. Soil535]